MSKPTLPEAIVSFDIESDSGWSSPATSNMWEIGISIMDATTGNELDSYSSLIQCRPNIFGVAETLEWMAKEGLMEKYKQCAYDGTESETISPRIVFTQIGKLFEKASKTHKLVFMARPANFDWMYFRVYQDLYMPNEYKKHVGFKCACLSQSFSDYCDMRQLSKEQRNDLWNLWKGEYTHTHCALDDAREQGAVYIQLVQERKQFAQRLESLRKTINECTNILDLSNNTNIFDYL